MKFQFFIASFLLPIFIFASVQDDANKSLQIVRADYSNLGAQIAKERGKFADEIIRAKTELNLLEAEFKNVRAEFIDPEALAKIVSEKTTAFENLRVELASLAQESLFDLKGARISHEANSFLSDLEEFLKNAENEIFSDLIFTKILTQSDVQAFVASFKNSNAGSALIDPSMGKISKLRVRTFAEEIVSGGIWMYPILIFGAIAFIIAILKSLGSLNVRRAPEGVVKNINLALSKDDVNGAMKIAKLSPKPYRALLVSFVKNRKIGKTLLEESAYEHMLSVGEKLYSGLGFLSVTAAVAPLLGLLGTVTGIIKTFADLSVYGTGNPQLMSAGISEALITTEYGLVVAIPAFVMHALLTRRAKAILSDMEKISSAFLSRNSDEI